MAFLFKITNKLYLLQGGKASDIRNPLSIVRWLLHSPSTHHKSRLGPEFTKAVPRTGFPTTLTATPFSNDLRAPWSLFQPMISPPYLQNILTWS